MGVSLLILEGKQKGREIPLPETIFLIGRDQQCHLRPHCEAVSQLHCAIAAWSGKVRVRDLQSRNGTIVNGLKIRGEIEVEDGDELQIGTLTFRIKYGKSAKNSPLPSSDDEAKWLLFSAADSPVLAPGFGTWVAPADSELMPDGSVKTSKSKKAPQATRDEAKAGAANKSVSAGDQLISFIEKRNKKGQKTPPRED